MIFKDRTEAGRKLADLLIKDKEVLKNKKDLLVLSILRGGVVVGREIAKKLNVPHSPLVVKKIGAPENEELAIGAICDGEFYLDNNLIKRLNLSQMEVNRQIEKTREKLKEYQEKFVKKESNLQGKMVILVDDGVATGASVLAALNYLRKNQAKKIFLATPVAATDFDGSGFDKVFILHRDPDFSAVSQFYEDFPQLTDEEVFQIFNI